MSVAFDSRALPQAALDFLAERHLATLTTVRPDGTPHVVPVGFTYDAELRRARIITGGASRKVANVAAGADRVALCQVDGWRWLTLEGRARVVRDTAVVAAAVEASAARYRQPRENPERVVLEVMVERVLGLVERRAGPAAQRVAPPADQSLP